MSIVLSVCNKVLIYLECLLIFCRVASQPSSLQVKGVILQSTAGNTIATLTGNIRKYWTLKKTGKQEPSRTQSTQKKTNIISMEYPSNHQIFGNQYYEKGKQRKQLSKLQHHQTESTKVHQQVWFYTGPQPKPANQK